MGLLVGIMLMAAAAASGDTLAPARAGQLQCYNPDTARKTCVALAGYDWAADGSISNRAEVLVSASPLITATTRTPIVLRDGAICGPLRREDFQGATISMDGKPASPELTQKVRDGMSGAMASAIGKEICTTYVPEGQGFAAKVTLDGVAHPEMAAKVIWVRPDEGYRVSP